MSGLRDSDHHGIKWMGNIPVGWSAHPVKRHYDVQLGKMLQNQSASPEDRFVPYVKALHVLWGKVNINDLPEMWASPYDITQYGIQDGDLLVCEGGEVGRAGIVIAPPANCIIQNSCHRVRPKNSADIHFLQYVLCAVNTVGWFNVLCNRATIAHFTREKLAELRIPVPPTDEQRVIADLLDQKMAKIDKLVGMIARLAGEVSGTTVSLLREYRLAVIAAAVTGKIDVRQEAA